MNMFLVIRNTVALTLLTMASSAANADLIYKEDFEGGKWQSFWGSHPSVSLSSELPKDGIYASRWNFKATANGDAHAEARFDLGGNYKDLSIRFDLYIPANYEHRNSTGSDNNKFFRLWSTDYSSDKEKLGASLLPQGSGESRIGSDWKNSATKGMSTGVVTASDFITASDLGKWMRVVIYVKAATDSSNTILQIYKNGTLHLDTSRNLNYVPGTQGYRYGYLFGWANSGFTQNTFLFIDNVEFHDSNIMSNAPRPPTFLTIN